jgi:hypothetical protein
MKTANASRCIGIGMAGLGLLIGMAGRVEADPILVIGNFPPTNDMAQVGIFPGNAIAAGFRIPSFVGFELDSFTMRAFAASPDTTAKVELFGDSGGIPAGPALDTFSAPVIPDQFGDVTVTPTLPFSLQSDTTYWIVVTDLTGAFNWGGSSPPITPTGFATSEGYLEGASFPPTLPLGAEFAPTFQVDGTGLPGGGAVPEPSSLLLGTIGVVLSMIYVQRRRGRS